MRCDCCGRILTDFEATRKSRASGEYLNTCNKCLDGLGIETIDREDLQTEEENLDDFFDSYSDDEEEDDY